MINCKHGTKFTYKDNIIEYWYVYLSNSNNNNIRVWHKLVNMISVLVWLLLFLMLTTQDSVSPTLKIGENLLIYVPNIAQKYSITQQIHAPTKQVSNLNSQQNQASGRPNGAPIQQVANNFAGFVKQASEALSPWLNKKPIDPPSQNMNLIPITNNINQVNRAGEAERKDQLKLLQNIVFEQVKTQMKGQRNYDIIKIDQSKVIDSNGQIKKTTKQKLAISSNQGQLIQIFPKPTESQPIFNKPVQTQTPSSSTLRSQQIISINTPTAKQLEVLSEEQKVKQREMNEQNIIKIIFSSFFAVAILLIVFGYRPTKVSESMPAKDDQESRLK